MDFKTIIDYTFNRTIPHHYTRTFLNSQNELAPHKDLWEQSW
jgi:hypothetical protein